MKNQLRQAPIKILLFEDGLKSISLQIQKDLDSELFIVETLSDPNEAVSAMGEDCFDLNLVLIPAQVEIGLELIQHAISKGSTHPIIAIGNQERPGIDVHAIQKGAVDFIFQRELNQAHLRKTISYALERHAANIALHQQAKYDSLTNVGNRQFFSSKLELAIEDAEKKETQFALMFLDLDGFKAINDTLGHETGDKLLRLVAERILRCTRNVDFVGRMGGDEFTVLFDRSDENLDIGHLVQRILEKVSKPYEIDGKEVFVGASAGVALYPRDGKSPSELLRSADHAMYKAKAKDRNSYQFFSKQMHAQNKREQDEKQRLRKAFDNDELKIFFQPVFDFQKNCSVELEALVRWDHGGLVATAETFLNSLRNCEWLDEFTSWAFRTSVTQFKGIKSSLASSNESMKDLNLCFNFTERELVRFKDPQRLFELILSDSSVPEQLMVEVNEKNLCQHLGILKPILFKLKEHGVRISIDHFGTGHFNFWSLQELPIDQIKIAPALCQQSLLSNGGKVILKNVIQLCEQLGVRPVVTGIETKRQLEHHTRNGCTFGQGYYLCSPSSDKDIVSHFSNKEYSSKIENTETKLQLSRSSVSFDKF